MAEMHTRACARCGASFSANQRFCTNCGATVDVVPSVSLDSAPGGRNFSPPPPPVVATWNVCSLIGSVSNYLSYGELPMYNYADLWRSPLTNARGDQGQLRVYAINLSSYE